MEPWVQPLDRCSVRLFHQLAEGAENNLVVSPFSVYVALCMLSAEAAGEMETELVQLLGLPADRAERRRGGQTIGQRVAALARSGVTLEVAQRGWVQRSYQLLPEFLRELREGFDAVPAVADFETDAEGARREIHAWVET